MQKNISINHLEMRLIVPLVLGIMFGLGDEVSNPDGTILQGKVALLVKIVFSARYSLSCFMRSIV